MNELTFRYKWHIFSAHKSLWALKGPKDRILGNNTKSFRWRGIIANIHSYQRDRRRTTAGLTQRYAPTAYICWLGNCGSQWQKLHRHATVPNRKYSPASPCVKNIIWDSENSGFFWVLLWKPDWNLSKMICLLNTVLCCLATPFYNFGHCYTSQLGDRPVM